MPEQLYADVAQTTVPGGVAGSGTTVITVASSADFPAALSATDKEFQAAFVDLTTTPPTTLEYITVRNISGTTWTILRATAAASRFPAAARSAGVGIRAVLTAAVISRFIPQNRNPYHDIRKHGAVGTNDTTNAGAVECTQAIVDAMAEANLSTTETFKRDDVNGSGWTYIPGNRDYKVCSGAIQTLQIPQVTKVIGGSGSGIGTGSPPRLRYHGTAGGTLAEHASSAVNIVGIHLEHILLDGRSYDHVSAAGYGNGALNLFKYRPTGANAAKPDTGSQFIDVWLHGAHGDGFRNESLGMTNWLWSRGRADAIGGYPFYVKASGGAFGTIEKMTWDPGATAGRSKGFLFLDGEAETGNGKSYFTLDDLHLELNCTLAQTYIPTGWSPTSADTRGVIRLGVSPDAPSVVQHVISHRKLWVPIAPAAGPTSLFQHTSADLTADHRARHARAVRISGDSEHGLGGGSGDSEASGAVMKLLGGVLDADGYPFGPGKTQGTRQIGLMSYHPRNDVPAGEGTIDWFKGRCLIDGLNLPQSATVGSAGGGAALPATPVKYLVVYDDAGNQYKIPAYNP